MRQSLERPAVKVEEGAASQGMWAPPDAGEARRQVLPGAAGRSIPETP